jgi:hypothetical protein
MSTKGNPMKPERERFTGLAQKSWMSPFIGLPALAAAFVSVMLSAQSANAQATYCKEIYFIPLGYDTIPVGTPVQAGGVYRGWVEPDITTDKQQIFNDGKGFVAQVNYQRAQNHVLPPHFLQQFQPGQQPAPPEGGWPLPILAGSTAATNVPKHSYDTIPAGLGAVWAYGAYDTPSGPSQPYDKPLPAPPTPDEFGNWADGRATVLAPLAAATTVKDKGGNDLKVPAGSVKAIVDGRAKVGGDLTWGALSADSFTAVSIPVASSIIQSGNGGGTWKAIDRNYAWGASNSTSLKDKVGVRDPCVLSLTDQDTGDVISQDIMEQNLDAAGGGTFSIADSGITLSVPRTPGASASLDFATESSWVQNPYSYGADLTPDGFTAYGVTPLSDWTVTTTSDTITATFSFGPDGLPFDCADVDPSSSMTPGDSYTYTVNDSDGAFETAVPEPGMAGVIAATGLTCLLRRRKRQWSD